MKTSVTVAGYSRKLSAVAFIKLIRQATGDSLALTKHRVDGLLEGKPFRLEFENEESARRFSDEAARMGATIHGGIGGSME